MALASCSGGSDPVKTFVNQFASAYDNGKADSVKLLYPTAPNGVEFCCSELRSDSLKIDANEAGNEIKVTMLNGATLLIAKAEDGTMKILESTGFAKFDAEKMKFAKATGWVEDGMNDQAVAERLSDDGFVNWLMTSFVTEVKSALKAKITGTWGDDKIMGVWMSSAGTIVTVTNSSNYDIPAEAYTLTSRSWYWGDPSNKDKVNDKTEMVPANGSVQIRSKSGADSESDNDVILSVREEALSSLFYSSYVPNGSEYSSYKANQ